MTSEWKTYRTRFLVQAKQLTSALSFVDHLGRQHCGRKGDYLVESYDGVLSIAPRQIFEDIYVSMSNVPAATVEHQDVPTHSQTLNLEKFEALQIETVRLAKFPRRRRTDISECSTTRKSPQPVRSTRSNSNLSLM